MVFLKRMGNPYGSTGTDAMMTLLVCTGRNDQERYWIAVVLPGIPTMTYSFMN